jgi:hypothetical protein
MGIVETEEPRRKRQFEETIRRRIVEGRARLGLPPRTFNDSERREPAGMSVEEILQPSGDRGCGEVEFPGTKKRFFLGR